MIVENRLVCRKVLLRRLAVFLISAVLFITLSHSAQAYNLFGGKWSGKPAPGVCCANFYVQLLTPMSSKGLTGWQNAISAWNGSSADVVLYTISSSVISAGEYNFGTNSYGCNGCDGITNLNPCYTCSTYIGASLYINTYYTSQSQYTNAVLQAVTAHEFGHLFGLAHSNGCVLMNPYTFGSGSRWDSCHINTPQNDDSNGVNSLY